MIGVAARDIGPSELLSELAIANMKDVCYFVENSAKPIIPLGKPALNIVDAFTFRGPLVATSLSTATKLLNMPCVGGRYFYVWNLEWLNKRVEYSSLWPYFSPRIKLIARCEDYKVALKNCFNVEADVMNSFEDVYKFLKSKDNMTYDVYTLKNGEKQSR